MNEWLQSDLSKFQTLSSIYWCIKWIITIPVSISIVKLRSDSSFRGNSSLRLYEHKIQHNFSFSLYPYYIYPKRMHCPKNGGRGRIARIISHNHGVIEA